MSYRESIRLNNERRCIWSGSATLYYCPGSRPELPENWVRRQSARNYPCSTPHSSGARHLCLNMIGVNSGCRLLQVALTEPEADQLSVLAHEGWGMGDSPELIGCFSGLIYEEETGVLQDLVLELKWHLNKAHGTVCEGREIRIILNDVDRSAFRKIDSDLTAELQAIAQKKPSQSKNYQRMV